VCEYLIDVMGAETNAQNETGFAPLHAAARGGADAVLSCLLLRGGDLSIEDVNGWTSLHFGKTISLCPIRPFRFDTSSISSSVSIFCPILFILFTDILYLPLF
jgi:hypothetical protein